VPTLSNDVCDDIESRTLVDALDSVRETTVLDDFFALIVTTLGDVWSLRRPSTGPALSGELPSVVK
jgi:hypothetical protein